MLSLFRVALIVCPAALCLIGSALSLLGSAAAPDFKSASAIQNGTPPCAVGSGLFRVVQK